MAKHLSGSVELQIDRWVESLVREIEQRAKAAAEKRPSPPLGASNLKRELKIILQAVLDEAQK